MDPFSILGAAASIGQLLDLADKTAKSAWSLARSIANAPTEVTKLAEKLERFKMLVEQTQKQRQDVNFVNLDELFPTVYRNILYNLLESNATALESLKSLHPSNPATPMTTKGRVRWATIDKRKAKAILADMKDAESSLDTALSIVTM